MAAFGGNSLDEIKFTDLFTPEDDLLPFILPAGSTNAKLSAQRYFSKENYLQLWSSVIWEPLPVRFCLELIALAEQLKSSWKLARNGF